MSDIQLSDQAKSLKLGFYEHYKKKQYEVLGVAVHSETLEELVVYKALYGEGLTWVRPFAMFTENVTVDGVEQPRFRYVEEN